MGGKAQEADRVRMEQELRDAVADVTQSLQDATRVAPYDERLQAWSVLVAVSAKAHQVLTGYMAKYGLLGEVNE